MSSSLVDKCLKKEFVDAGVNYNYKVTATKIRKMIATQVRMKQPQHAPIVAKQLLHLETMQEKSYLLVDKSHNSFVANKIIRQITCGSDDVENARDTATETNEQETNNNIPLDTNLDTQQELKKNSEINYFILDNHLAMETANKRIKCRWPGNVKLEVKSHFKNCIESQNGPSEDDINNVIYSDQYFQFYKDLWEKFGKPTEKKFKRTLYDTVRKMMNSDDVE